MFRKHGHELGYKYNMTIPKKKNLIVITYNIKQPARPKYNTLKFKLNVCASFLGIYCFHYTGKINNGLIMIKLIRNLMEASYI